jgi:hypothetical protein
MSAYRAGIGTSMSAQVNPAAVDPIPAFVTAPGESDLVMVAVAIFLILCVIGFGVLFFRLHTLPERIAHKSKKIQFEIVAVLGLISLFTHMHIFWVIGLLLALVDFPDFGGVLNRIATGVEDLSKTRTIEASPTDDGGNRPGGAQLIDALEERTKPTVRTLASVDHV